ncbi:MULTISPECIES: phosphatase PAP2 family protein [unclassified Virgibacillus]|uniref:phosphatase PAP2 family protein n=1 Tax=unclassified Virgibacillus TaxID=2620237 RepID=UPI0024DEE1AD|nr:phosphatase PAP2 family protein [Virgibacillus sp. LDC-1]
MMIRKRQMIYILLGFSLFMVGIWIVKIINGELPLLDQWSRSFVVQMENTSIYTFFRIMTEFGSRPFILPFTIGVALLLMGVNRDWLPSLVFAGGTLLSHFLNNVIKFLVQRERPTILVEANAEGFSFPSGHAMTSMVCYGLLSYFIVKKIKSAKIAFGVQFFFALLIFLIGISRYVINVHYLTDVAAGFLFGFLLFYGLIQLYEYVNRLRSPS